MEDSKSYTALRTSRKSHFKSFNYSSHYYIWKKVSQSVDANISEIQGNSEATAGTEELKLLSTLKLKRTLCERGKEKKKQTSSPIRCTIHTYQREPHRRNEPFGCTLETATQTETRVSINLPKPTELSSRPGPAIRRQVLNSSLFEPGLERAGKKNTSEPNEVFVWLHLKV